MGNHFRMTLVMVLQTEVHVQHSKKLIKDENSEVKRINCTFMG